MLNPLPIMNDDPMQNPPRNIDYEKERTKRVSSCTSIAAVTAVFSMIILVNEPSWPAAFGVMGLSGMAMVVCYYILHQK